VTVNSRANFLSPGFFLIFADLSKTVMVGFKKKKYRAIQFSDIPSIRLMQNGYKSEMCFDETANLLTVLHMEPELLQLN